MDGVEAGDERGFESQRVAAVKFERIVRLIIDIDADDIETRSMVARRGASGATEEIQKPRSCGHENCPPMCGTWLSVAGM